MKKFVTFIMLFWTSLQVIAQDSTSVRVTKKEKKEKINLLAKKEEEGVLNYTKQTLVGFKVVNDGYGGFLEFGKRITENKSLLYQFEVCERKSMKEEKLQNPYYQSTSFVFGKINFFYPVKLGVQYELLLGNKGNRNGVNISANFGGGLSLALLRPYMLQVDKGNINFDMVTFNSPDSLYYLYDDSAIYVAGGPSFSQGWKNLKLKPGIYAKSSLRFDYGKYNEMINGLEVGITAEYYTKDIPLMVRIDQKRFFMGLYASILFGKRK
jgi:hypothetical protein